MTTVELASDPHWKDIRTYQTHSADCGTWMRIASENVRNADGTPRAVNMEGDYRCGPCGNKKYLGI